MGNVSGWPAYAGLIFVLLFILALASLALAVWTGVRIRRLERHYRALTDGADGHDLPALLEDHVRQLRAALEQVTALGQVVQALRQESSCHVQHLGFLRFNPFRETGGDQSFVLALADARGDGAVISSLHSRDQTRVYAKPLSAWQSVYPLTDEEQAAIQQAQTRA